MNYRLRKTCLRSAANPSLTVPGSSNQEHAYLYHEADIGRKVFYVDIIFSQANSCTEKAVVMNFRSCNRFTGPFVEDRVVNEPKIPTELRWRLDKNLLHRYLCYNHLAAYYREHGKRTGRIVKLVNL